MSEEPTAENQSPSRPTGWLIGFVLAGLAVLVMGFVIIQVVGQDEVAAAAPETATTAAAGSDGGGVAGGDVSAGAAVYSGTCQACHGPDGVGIEGLGKALAASEFVQALTDEELVAMIATGRPSGDPDNTTGVDMPGKGGNPSLSDGDLQDVVAYMRTLQ